MSRQFVTAAVFVLVAAACTSAGAEVVEQPVETTAPPTSAVPTTTPTAPPSTTTVADPLSEPETISALSRLGRMTWELYDLDFMVTHVGSYEDGYVALLYPSLAHRPEYGGLADPGLVATSEDGAAWTPLPEQPGDPSAFTAQVLAVDEDRLVVLGRPFGESGAPRTDDLLAFVWDGAAWSEFPVDLPVGSLPRGGQIDTGYLADGTPIFIRGSAGYALQILGPGSASGMSWSRGGQRESVHRPTHRRGARGEQVGARILGRLRDA